MADRIRIALCDDHAVVRSGLRRILEAEPDLEIVGEAGSAAEAVEVARDTQPDVFVMDVGLPDRSGIAATADVCATSPATRVLVLTVHDDVAYLRRAFDAGAAGYFVKEAADVEMVQAVRQVAAGKQYVHPSLGAALLAPDAATSRPAGPGGELSETRGGGSDPHRERSDQRRDRRAALRLGPDRGEPPGSHPSEAQRADPS